MEYTKKKNQDHVNQYDQFTHGLTGSQVTSSDSAYVCTSWGPTAEWRNRLMSLALTEKQSPIDNFLQIKI